MPAPHEVAAFRPQATVTEAQEARRRYQDRPLIPPPNLRGVSTISAKLYRAFVEDREPTRKQKAYGRKMIARACVEIRQRRDAAAMASLEHYERLASISNERKRNKGRKSLYE